MSEVINEKQTEQKAAVSHKKMEIRTGKKVLWLRNLGDYRIYRDEDYNDVRGDDKSYCQYIRVYGSKEGIKKGDWTMPSNLYKYSETHLGLYMKDRNRKWPLLAEITRENFNGFDHLEEEFIFPISKFPEVEKIIKFVPKRKMSDQRKAKLREVINRSKPWLRKREIKGTIEGSLNTNIEEKKSGNATTPLSNLEGEK